MAGLVVDGAADVTISSSNFTENNRARYGGSALIAWGQSTVRVTQTGFVANAHGEDDTYGGEGAAAADATTAFLAAAPAKCSDEFKCLRLARRCAGLSQHP